MKERPFGAEAVRDGDDSCAGAGRTTRDGAVAAELVDSDGRRKSWPRACAAGLTMCVLTWVLTACGQVEMTQTKRELYRRPTYEQALKTYTEMMTEMYEVARATVPQLPWQPPVVESPVGDAKYPELKSQCPRIEVSTDGAVPDEVWPRFTDALFAVAKRYGFDQRPELVAGKGAHQINFTGHPDGGRIDLGGGGNTSFLLYAGCYLPASLRNS